MRNLKLQLKKLSPQIDKNLFEDIWSFLNTDYYLRRHNDDEVAWHIDLIAKNGLKNVVSIRENQFKGCTELSIYQNERKNIFSYIANVIDNLNINIVDAKIITLNNNQAIDTYLLLDINGSYIKDEHTLIYLKDKIENIINASNYKTKNYEETNRKYRKFSEIYKY